MTTPKKSAAKRKSAKGATRAKRKPPARSGAIRTGSSIPKEPAEPQPSHSVGMSPQAHANADLDEGLINKAVADAVRNANDVFTETVAQTRVAASQFQQGDYNIRDVPVDVQIMGVRMIRLARELSETTLNIAEQILKQLTKTGPAPQPSGSHKVPPFPTPKPKGKGAPPNDKSAPPSSAPAPQAADGRKLDLTVHFEGKAKAKVLESPLWKPAQPTLPSQLNTTPLLHMLGDADPIEDVSFDVDVGGSLIATIGIPAHQPPGIYAGMVVPDNTDTPLGVITIEVVK